MKLYRLLIVLFVCRLGASAAVSAQTESAAELPNVDPNAVQITLQHAIEMALENNLDIVVSRLDTQVQAEGVSVARGVYQPFVSLGINTLDSSSPAQNQLVGAQTLTSWFCVGGGLERTTSTVLHPLPDPACETTTRVLK